MVDNIGEYAIMAMTPANKKLAPTRMMFTDEDIDELLSQPCANPLDFNIVKFVFDKGLYERVWHRANYLRKLKTKIDYVA